MSKCIWAMDLSLSNTGLCVFVKSKPIGVFSVSTSSKKEHKDRLKDIADFVLEKIIQYPPNLIVFESGFTRHHKSTQALYKVLGVVSYLLSDYEQMFYAPSTIKKVVCGNGRASKDNVYNAVLKRYPKLQMANNDESDAVAVGMCYFLEEGR